MPLLLAIETATEVCSVALVAETGAIASGEILRPRAHAAHLVPLVEDVLRREGASVADLDAVAVSAGPGSFTGLRIGVSAAKGLAFASGASLIAVPSLEALASSAVDVLSSDDALVVAFSSRRGEAFVAAYRRDGKHLEQIAPTSAMHLDALAGWLPEVAGQLWIAGEAAPAVAAELAVDARVLDPAVVRPRAESVGRIGWRRWQERLVEDVASFEPAYLQEFEARRGGSIFERLPR